MYCYSHIPSLHHILYIYLVRHSPVQVWHSALPTADLDMMFHPWGFDRSMGYIIATPMIAGAHCVSTIDGKIVGLCNHKSETVWCLPAPRSKPTLLCIRMPRVDDSSAAQWWSNHHLCQTVRPLYRTRSNKTELWRCVNPITTTTGFGPIAVNVVSWSRLNVNTHTLWLSTPIL